MTVTSTDCIPLHFFRKLPLVIKVEIDELAVELFQEDDMKDTQNI